MKNQLIATTTFGLEAIVRREIESLGYRIINSENGKITYESPESGIARSNLWLRSADRVLLKMGEFKALEFEELFQQVKGIPWEELIPSDAKILVTGSSVKSKLSSVPACQSITKKAIVMRLKENLGLMNLPETGKTYTIKISFLKDIVTVTVDTTGAGLHKRGYRTMDVKAPIKKTLAAALVSLSFWKEGRLLVDPCCGSGTILIEAAMIGKNIAPGLNRSFVSEEWDDNFKKIYSEERKRAFSMIKNNMEGEIYGSDIDKKAIIAARENAIEAGVDDVIKFRIDDIKNLRAEEKNGIIITNPPYGERIGDSKEIDKIYRKLAVFSKENPTWSIFAITSDRNFEEKVFKRKADRRRKLYNGRLEVCYYQFHSKK